MKQLSFLFFALALATVHADTNTYPLLVTANGISYTNAHIYRATPVEVTLWHDGGSARVALTNLPAALRLQYPYDSNAAAQYPVRLKQQAADARAAAAARQAWLQEQAKNAGLIYIVSADTRMGRCEAMIQGRTQTIHLNNAPDGLAANANLYGAKYKLAEADYVTAGLKDDTVGQVIATQSGRDAVDGLPRVRAFYIGDASDDLPVWQCVTSGTRRPAGSR